MPAPDIISIQSRLRTAPNRSKSTSWLPQASQFSNKCNQSTMMVGSSAVKSDFPTQSSSITSVRDAANRWTKNNGSSNSSNSPRMSSEYQKCSVSCKNSSISSNPFLKKDGCNKNNLSSPSPTKQSKTKTIFLESNSPRSRQKEKILPTALVPKEDDLTESSRHEEGVDRIKESHTTKNMKANECERSTNDWRNRLMKRQPSESSLASTAETSDDDDGEEDSVTCRNQDDDDSDASIDLLTNNRNRLRTKRKKKLEYMNDSLTLIKYKEMHHEKIVGGKSQDSALIKRKAFESQSSINDSSFDEEASLTSLVVEDQSETVDSTPVSKLGMSLSKLDAKDQKEKRKWKSPTRRSPKFVGEASLSCLDLKETEKLDSSPVSKLGMSLSKLDSKKPPLRCRLKRQGSSSTMETMEETVESESTIPSIVSNDSYTYDSPTRDRKKKLLSNPAFLAFQQRNRPPVMDFSPSVPRKRLGEKWSLLNSAKRKNDETSENNKLDSDGSQAFGHDSFKADSELLLTSPGSECTKENKESTKATTKRWNKLTTNLPLSPIMDDEHVKPKTLSTSDVKPTNPKLTIREEKTKNIDPSGFDTSSILEKAVRRPSTDRKERPPLVRCPTGLQAITKVVKKRVKMIQKEKDKKKKTKALSAREEALKRKAQLKKEGKLKLTINEQKNSSLEVEHLNDFSTEYIATVWWSPQEYTNIKKDFETVIFLMENNKPINDKEQCSRGLEKRTEDGAWELYEAQRDARNAVLDLQDTLQRKRMTDPNQIAKLYQEKTSNAAKDAVKRARHDAREAKRYTNELLVPVNNNAKKTSSPTTTTKSVNVIKHEFRRQARAATPKYVKFAEEESVVEIPHFRCVSKQEHENIWFTESEKKAMEEEYLAVVKLLEKEADIDEKKMSARGLEYRTKDGKLRLYAHQRGAWDVVLNLQAKQRKIRNTDENEIARVYNEKTEKCCRKALKRARRDHKEVASSKTSKGKRNR